MSDILIYSFHTLDEYYTNKAEELRKNLESLGLDYAFDSIEIPKGKEWPDICRKKIELIYAACNKYPDKKIFWIDIDCNLTYLPDFVKNFSADLIGYQRGFGVPVNIGYANKARFWEPCFLGINSTKYARKFISDAYEMEKSFEDSATDDYFFEESWRRNSPFMSFQIIPSQYGKVQYRDQGDLKPFFYFGSSGNVAEYQGKVIQHSRIGASNRSVLSLIREKIYQYSVAVVKRISPERVLNVLRKVKKKLSNAPEKISTKAFKISVLRAGKLGNEEEMASIVKTVGGEVSLTSKQSKVLHLAKSLSEYYNAGMLDVRTSDDRLSLCWWINPEPGNFGDWLSPYIMHRYSGKQIKYVNPNRNKITEKHYFCIGSIGKFTKDNSVILGTGVSAKDATLSPKARYLAVRGPHTRALVLSAGGECPEVYGDPAILMPRVYKPSNLTKNNKVGLIRHFTHKNIPLLLPENIIEIDVLGSSPSDIEKFIDQVCSCSSIISSAMHGYIVSQAYGIPCGLVNFEGYENNVHGDGLKYHDYFEGVKLPPREPVVLPVNLVDVDFKSLVTEEKINESIIDELEAVFISELR